MSRMWSHNLVPGTSVWKQNGLSRGDQKNARTAAFLVVALPVCLAGQWRPRCRETGSPTHREAGSPSICTLGRAAVVGVH